MEPWPLIVLALLSSAVFLLIKQPAKKGNLPPGPRPWPIIGNLPDLLRRQNSSSQRLHAALASLSADYGPLLHLRLGSRHIVVASSPSAAEHALKTQDRSLSSRYVPATYQVPVYADHSLIWHLRCDDNWRLLRSLFRADLLSPRSLSLKTPAMQKKAKEMAYFFLKHAGEELPVGKIIFTTLFNILGDMVFSRDVLSLEKDKGYFPDLKQNMSKILELGGQPSIQDFWPAITADIQGLKRKVKIYLKKIYGIWDEIIEQRREGEEDNFLKVLLDNGVHDIRLKAVLLDIFTAGTDTSAALAEWIMAELVRNPEIMKKVRDEIADVIGEKKMAIPDESQLSRLVYLHACVKEALRLHPPAPLLLPRCAMDGCEMMGYDIPKGSTVLVNAWAIGRDEREWDDPLRFWPERFLDSSVDYKGRDFVFIPFGGGVRTCPGISMAIRMIMLVLATMVGNFEWVLPGGRKPEELDMEEKVGLVLERKEPLVLIPKPLEG